ncbi:MAG: F0F1 ATP synthase subunit A [Terriglobales bacterium]
MEQLPFTALLNKYFGSLALALLHALRIRVRHPAAPIRDSVAMEILVAILLLLFFFLVRSRLSVESPGGLQHVAEWVYSFVNKQSEEIIGHDNKPYIPFLVTLGLFILPCNLLGLVPGFESPTANPSVPLGCAVVTFIYYNLQGIKKQGALRYAAHFAGPMPALAILMVPIELISHTARMLSLTVRLFANMFAGDMVTLIFFSLVPLGIPIVFMGLHMAVSIIQTYVFVLLAMVYLGGAVAEGH